jgi:hypothetical protein
VDAGRLGASVLYAKLQGNQRFREQLAKAQQEFAEKTGTATGVKSTQSQVPAANSNGYNLQGQRTDTPSAPGIYIRNSKKYLVK